MTDQEKPWHLPEWWDDRFQTDNTPWDRGFPSPSLVDLEKRLEFLPGSTMIVPGCGFGREVLHFAALGYQVSAVDFSKTAIEEVRVLAKRKEVSVELLCSDYWEIPESWFGTFDIFVEHTFFCSFDPSLRSNYVEQASTLLRRGGNLIGSFLVNEKASERYSGSPPYWITEKDLRETFEKEFDIIKLELSPHQLEPFKGTEWWGHFKKK